MQHELAQETPELKEPRQTPARTERVRVERVVETLSTFHNKGESLAEVAHEARNMVTALGLYCDLLEEPGVLATPYIHYGRELRLVAAASRRLVEKLVTLEAGTSSGAGIPAFPRQDSGRWPVFGSASRNSVQSTPASPEHSGAWSAESKRRLDMLPAVPVANLAAELLANRNLLSALAGPSIALTVNAEGGAQAVRLTGEDLTRVLVNLVKNAAEAMPGGGRIHIGLRQRPPMAGTASCLALTVEDNGPGIPELALETIFHSGYTTRTSSEASNGWQLNHRGLGLAITRSIVEAAGGRIAAASRGEGGARFEIELPAGK
jgi:signal transduction histidine kinase